MTKTTLLLIATLLMTGCGKLERFEFSQPGMGTVFRIVLYAPDEKAASAAATAAFERVEQLNSILSDYLPDSELSRLSATAGSGRAVTVSDDLRTMLDTSQRIARETDRAFDITVGPLVQLWRDARKLKKLPDPDKITAAKRAVGYEKLTLDLANQTATLTEPGMKLDLGGIAKGFAADEAMKVLRKHGVRRALVAAAGDILTSGPPPGKPGWKVAVQPFGESGGNPRMILLKHAAVSTSGDLFQYVEIDGKRYSHIVDPKTGVGLTNRLAVTVVHRNATQSDAWATALCVLGSDRGLKVADSALGISALFATQDEAGNVRTVESARAKSLRFVTP